MEPTSLGIDHGLCQGQVCGRHSGLKGGAFPQNPWQKMPRRAKNREYSTAQAEALQRDGETALKARSAALPHREPI